MPFLSSNVGIQRNGAPSQSTEHQPRTLLVRKHLPVTGAELLYPPNPTTNFTIRLFVRRRMFVNASPD